MCFEKTGLCHQGKSQINNDYNVECTHAWHCSKTDETARVIFRG